MTTAKQNRAAFPFTAEALDFFRSIFGDDVKLLYAIEGGKTVGKKPKPSTNFISPMQWLDTSMRLSGSESYAEIQARLFSASKSNNPKRGRS